MNFPMDMRECDIEDYVQAHEIAAERTTYNEATVVDFIEKRYAGESENYRLRLTAVVIASMYTCFLHEDDAPKIEIDFDAIFAE